VCLYLSLKLITFRTATSFNSIITVIIIINAYLQKTHAAFWKAAMLLSSFHIRQHFNDLRANGCHSVCVLLCSVAVLCASVMLDNRRIGWRHDFLNVLDMKNFNCIRGIYFKVK
jgi:hypothetical protein